MDFYRRFIKKNPLCFLWLFETCAGLYHVRVMDHEQLTLCSISVILHSRQSTGNLSYSGKTKCGPCRYPQRLQRVFRIHFHDSKATVPKVPLEAPENPASPGGSPARRHWLGFEHCSLFDCIEFLFIVQPQPEGRAVGREKLNFWGIWLQTSVTGPQCPWLQPELLAPGDLMPPGLMSAWCNLELNTRGYQIVALEYINP